MLTAPFQLPPDIACETLEAGNAHRYRRNSYQLAYVVAGTGILDINGNRSGYHAGMLFLLSPLVPHAVEVDAATQLLFVRFSEEYLKSHHGAAALHLVLHTPQAQQGWLQAPQDQELAQSLAAGIIREHGGQNLFHQSMAQQLANALLTLALRNIGGALPGRAITAAHDSRIMEILRHLHAYIYTPDELCLQKLAGHFGLSLKYLGELFRKQTGLSLQHYITRYRMQLVEARLLHSNMRICEIAQELQFTDESHLNRMFRRYKGLSPSAFRKRHAAGQ